MVIWYGSNRKLIQLSFYVTMYLDNFFTSVPVVVHCSFAHLRLILCELMDYSTSGFTVLLHLPAAAAKSLQSCLTLWDPIDGSPPGSPSLRFSRQEHWGGSKSSSFRVKQTKVWMPVYLTRALNKWSTQSLNFLNFKVGVMWGWQEILAHNRFSLSPFQPPVHYMQ